MQTGHLLIEPLIVFDATLRQDPAETYASMDFETREMYRKRVAFVARHSDYTESQVAQAALDLAREGAEHPSDDPRMQRRRIHVGYYLIDRGFSQLAARVEFHPRLVDRARMFIRAHADDFYITGIQFITILFIAAILFPVLPEIRAFSSLMAVLLFILSAGDAVRGRTGQQLRHRHLRSGTFAQAGLQQRCSVRNSPLWSRCPLCC